MPEACDGSRRWGERRAATACVLAAFALALAALAAVLGAGCTSDPANPTGSRLSDGPQFDSLLTPLRADTLKTFGELRVVDPKIPFSHYQVLYLGRQGTERSSILVRYNFATPIEPFPAGTAVTVENVKSVTLRLFQLIQYRFPKLYRVYTLATPLDSTLYVGPDLPPEPPTDRLIVSHYSAAGTDFGIPLPANLFVQWYQQVTPNGILITDADSTYSVADTLPPQPLPQRIAGYGSKEMGFARTAIGQLDSGTVVGPTITVEFNNPPNTFVRWQALVDVSSFASLLPLPATPADGLVLRTHLRAYPFVSFALDRLPPGVFIDRALLVVTNDTSQSYGPLASVLCGEMPNEVLPRSGRVDSIYPLDSLRTRVRVVNSRTGMDPKTQRRLQLDVTLSIQRLVNHVYQRPFSFLLLSDESYSTSGINPDFYLRRLHFLGTEAPDPQDRPHLMIYYTKPGPVGGKSLAPVPGGKTR